MILQLTNLVSNRTSIVTFLENCQSSDFSHSTFQYQGLINPPGLSRPGRGCANPIQSIEVCGWAAKAAELYVDLQAV